MTNIEELVYRFRWQVALILVGFILAAGGVFLTLNKDNNADFEVVEGALETANGSSLIVEVSGAVNNPGVYNLSGGARIEDALGLAGGISSEANSAWIEKYLNRAAFVLDGQKVYIPWESEEVANGSLVLSEETGLLNINTATKNELEELSGIGPVYAQKIIDNRPYSSVEDMLMKKAVTQKIYDENKDLLTVY